jgi:hypothetical protein
VVAAAHPTPSGADATRPVRGDEFHIIGRPDGTGDAFDATMLFDHANDLVRDHHCDRALPEYDRIVQEFPASRVVPVAYFNRGVCLQSMRRWDDAAASFRETIGHTHEHDLTRDAWFRIATVAAAMEPQRPELVIEATNAVLALTPLSINDRVEAYARQAVAQLAQGDRAGAIATASRAVELAPTPEAVAALDDDSYVAQARFVQAEATRLEGAAIAINVTDPGLEAAITRRVELVMHAHVQFNDAIRIGNADWAAASGFRIGEMYGDLYTAIVNAPVPPDWDEHAVQIYRHRTSTRLRPLLTGAMRAWEATLAMAHRSGIDNNEWVRRADQQLAALREVILNDNSGSRPGTSTAPGGGSSGRNGG